MAKVVALMDTVGYLDADGNVAYASKGEQFDLDGKQLERKLEEGAVAKAGSKEAKQASGDGVPEDADQAAADEELTTPGGDPVDEPQTGRKKNG